MQLSNSTLLLLAFTLLPLLSYSQTIDHWEAAIVAENEWHYRLGDSEPSADWKQPGFDDSSWALGEGGFGYDDDDDNTILPPTLSVYLRREFEVINPDVIAAITLYADYDDAFVAYLNGEEIARANIGTIGVPPAYDETSITFREAELYQGGLPEAYPQTTQQLNTGINTLAIQVHNAGINSSDLSSLFYLILGISDDSDDYQPLPAWFMEPFESSNLPLLFVNTLGASIPDEPKIDALLGIVDNGPGNRNFLTDPRNGYDGNIGIEIRGSSSQFFAKKNYGFETRLANGENNNVNLLGMPSENDWILHGPYSDKSLMRNVLSFEIANNMGRYASRTRWCELFINQQYMGVYVLMEKIKRDDNRVDIANLRPDDISGDELTGGYIFSIDRDDQGAESGWYSPYTNDLFYRFSDPDFDELQEVQKDYLSTYVTSFEEAMNNSPSPEIYNEYVDVSSWIDYWIATEVFKHIDNYRLSFFMYKKKDSNGGKIHFGPLWDLNLGYGNFDYGQDPGPDEWSYVWTNSGFMRPFWILDLSNDPDIQNLTNCRWQELRQTTLNTDRLLEFIDSTALHLEEAQIRNFERWPVLGTYVWPNSFVGDTYPEEVSFLKNWLRDRLDWMDDNMQGDCSLVSAETTASSPTALSVFPNPVRDGVTFYLKGAPSGAGQLVLFDALGSTLLETVFASNSPETISLSQLPSGMYFYQLRMEGVVLHSGKLVKE
ncbi:MAG: CotH kinase family protein [Bacteroidota bacterium]